MAKCLKHNVLLLLLPCVCAVSCMADLSTEATIEIPDIVIQGLAPELSVPYGTELEIDATVTQEGRSQDDFDMTWTIELNPKTIKKYLISEAGRACAIS